MSLKYNGKNISASKNLRKNATPQENHLWYDFLSTYEVRFQSQKVIGNYIVDFYCHKAKLVVEIDGAQHLSTRRRRKRHTPHKGTSKIGSYSNQVYK